MRQSSKGKEERREKLEQRERLCAYTVPAADWVVSVPLGSICCERLSEHVMCDRRRTVSISSLTQIPKCPHTFSTDTEGGIMNCHQ